MVKQKKVSFTPGLSASMVSAACSHHIKGCCFDPDKTVRGFLATPCFGCLDQQGKEQESPEEPEEDLTTNF